MKRIGDYDALNVNKAVINDLTVKNIKIEDSTIKSDIGMTSKRIKELYEMQPDTNAYTNHDKNNLKQLIGNNSCINGGIAIGGDNNRITKRSMCLGSENTILGENATVIGQNNMIIHDNCNVIGNNNFTSANNQTIIGDNTTFKIPFVDDINDEELNERHLNICLDPNDGSLLFKVRYEDNVRVFKAPTYGPSIKVNARVERDRVNVDFSQQHI